MSRVAFKIPSTILFFPQRKHLSPIEEKGLAGAVHHDVVGY